MAPCKSGLLPEGLPCINNNIEIEIEKHGESLEQYLTGLTQLAATCDYWTAVDEQIRDQVIAACSSSKLRKRVLAEPELTLQKCITIGQTLESAHHHTKEIESTS